MEWIESSQVLVRKEKTGKPSQNQAIDIWVCSSFECNDLWMIVRQFFLSFPLPHGPQPGYFAFLISLNEWHQGEGAPFSWTEWSLPYVELCGGLLTRR